MNINFQNISEDLIDKINALSKLSLMIFDFAKMVMDIQNDIYDLIGKIRKEIKDRHEI